jgi:hypothetical protein
MKFMSILLNEGRKEDLRKKYSNKFNEPELNLILGSPILSNFNHKYTDFILKTIDPKVDFDMDFRIAMGLIQDFDKYQSSLPKKDINQYSSLSELESALEPIIEKNLSKDMSGQVDKIYEDDTFLILIPKTKEASCKYGSNTKWCVTMRTTDHFEQYTSGNQQLYFIINKKNTFDRDYSKIAVHYSENGIVSIWDSQDEKLSSKQVSLVRYALPNLFNAIERDYKVKSENKYESFLKESFNIFSPYTDYQYYSNNTQYSIFSEVDGFESVDDGMANGFLKIEVRNNNNNDVILTDNYILLVGYHFDKINTIVNVSITLSDSGEDEESFGTSIDLGFDGIELFNSFKLDYINNSHPKVFNSNVKFMFLKEINRLLQNNEILLNKLVGPNVWRPSRGGYKFKSADKGLISKLIKHLDDGYQDSTKLDFLTYIGKLDKKVENGKPKYSLKNKNDFRPSTDFRGHLSTFFSAAKSAGIIDYVRTGNKIVMKPGKNFEAFKSGKLKAL